MSNMKCKVLIAGAGHAGGMAAIALRQAGFDGSVTIVGEESDPPYERPALSKAYLRNELQHERLYLRKQSYWSEHDITLISKREVVKLSPERNEIDLCDGRSFEYTSLIWATGGRVRKLTITGSALPGVFYLRTLADVAAIKASLATTSKIVVIGGGYIGLEVAASARKLGHAVTVIEALPRVLARVTSETVSRFMEARHRAEGVDVKLGFGVADIRGSTHVTGVILTDGTVVPADMIIVGIGIVPNTEVLERTGIACKNGVLVDAQCRTSNPDIFAIGDCANHPSIYAGSDLIRLESVQNAVDQAKIVAGAIMGKDKIYSDLPWFWSDQYDIKLQTAGLQNGHDSIVLRGDVGMSAFSVIYLKNGQMIAIDAINSIKDFVAAKSLIVAKVKPDPARLADVKLALKDIMSA